MKLTNYGFIVLAPGYQPQENNSVMESEFFRTEMVGVSTLEEAISVAKNFVASGIQLIELCGGFDDEKANKLITILDSPVPIGVVSFSESERKKLSKFLSSE